VIYSWGDAKQFLHEHPLSPIYILKEEGCASPKRGGMHEKGI
jgi:hypothetical protein